MLKQCPQAKNIIKSFVGAREFINNLKRWCLWITGYSHNSSFIEKKMIFNYDGTSTQAKNINGYLADAPNVYIENKREPICDVQPMLFGSMANDFGNQS